MKKPNAITTKKWTVLFCDPSAAACPITDFLDRCRPEHRAKVLHLIGLLEELGPNLPRPYADLLHDGIHELRVKLSGEHVRLLYFFCFERFIVFFDVLYKHTDRVPEAVIRRTGLYRDKLLAGLNPAELEEAVRADA
jgi:phage-related protein